MTAKKPVIGITSSTVNHKGNDAVLIHYAYPEAIIKAGGTPLIIPIDVNEDSAENWVKLCDGILLSGGEDIDPLSYKQNPRPGVGRVNRDRDITEMNVVKMAKKEKTPLFAICRGISTLNVALGGTLIQDIEYEFGDDAIKHSQDAVLPDATHMLEIKEGTRLYEIMGSPEIEINSLHHQAIDDLAEDLTATAHAPDGVIEAVEGKDKSWPVLGVQWHPEEMAKKYENMQKLFDMFIEQCSSKEYAG
ncbi:gamma-glutamyl-gamma-aminobutyrate hydrolase family protein [Bacillus lacus]|uniref:Gamma-glutamyl-gamma-aminobutyrate hydrolase family protein n=1 Tax=Metabacillus lacus TaxID=1983721 RepID=A0A7X2LYQ1_9BACI|nr:gamma-glutamyl-gamma-aminobutyrate hydrolase family protein [Metabacillus lacus]MRX72591.1 gamma-glutamyl-gamma-aminobutyrate hydrolase family protein [Metabacillus lacus]